MKPKCFLVITVFILVSSCAFAPVSQPDFSKYRGQFPVMQTFPVSVEEGTKAAKETLEVMGLEVQTAIPRIGFVRTKKTTIPVPDFCDCGTWSGSEVSGDAEATLVVDVQPAGPGETTFELVFECILNFKGKIWYGATTRREIYACASKGYIENYFWTILSRKLEAQ
ncbi:MAG: hypothetical protein V2I56_16920 [Desulfobacteraceae bacterium]|jgi:hypothetical protein|nr:hypothetical protein [Desulfobacteraceae bacterium]